MAIAVLSLFAVVACGKEEVFSTTPNESTEVLSDIFSKDKITITWEKNGTLGGRKYDVVITITYDTETKKIELHIRGTIDGRNISIDGSGRVASGSNELTDSDITVTDDDGNIITIDYLDELISECLKDFWAMSGSGSNND